MNTHSESYETYFEKDFLKEILKKISNINGEILNESANGINSLINEINVEITIVNKESCALVNLRGKSGKSSVKSIKRVLKEFLVELANIENLYSATENSGSLLMETPVVIGQPVLHEELENNTQGQTENSEEFAHKQKSTSWGWQEVKYTVFLVFGLIVIINFLSGDDTEDSKKYFTLSTEQLKNELEGKWNADFYDLGTNWYYRFQFSGNSLEYWVKREGANWASQSNGIVGFRITDVITDENGEEYRTLVLDHSNLGIRRAGGVIILNETIRLGISRSSFLYKGWE